MNPLQYIPFIIQEALKAISGGDPFLMGMFGLIVLAACLFKLNVSIPTSAFITVLTLGMMSTVFDFPSPLTSTAVGPFTMLYLLVIALGGILLYHLLFKRVGNA